MSTEQSVVNVGNGGSAVVVTAPGVECPRPFDVHPQLCILPSIELPDALPGVVSRFPDNTRIVVIAGELPQHIFGLVRRAAQQRQIPWLHRSNDTAVSDLLRRVLMRPTNGTAAAPEGPTRTIKGSIAAFIQAEADLTKGAAEEARRLYALAQQRGIQTTFGSLSQGISNAKRKGGQTGVPRSIQPASVKALNTLQDSIAGLQLIAEYVGAVEKENGELRAERDALRNKLGKALKAVQDLQ